MAINERSEIEVKFFQGRDFEDLELIRNTLGEQGFVLGEKRIETDYLPDTRDGLCKQNGLLLRFRRIETIDTNRWLLTLKTRASTEGYLDFREIETPFENPDTETFEHINTVLGRLIEIQLDPSLLKATRLDEVMRSVGQVGLTATRILLDKYREEYTRGNSSVTLDFFPEQMGSYVEVEGHNIDEVGAIYLALGFKQDAIITTDYGDLLKEHKSGLPDPEQRTSTFGANERRRLLQLNV